MCTDTLIAVQRLKNNLHVEPLIAQLINMEYTLKITRCTSAVSSQRVCVFTRSHYNVQYINAK